MIDAHTYLGMASPLTTAGYNALVAMIWAMSTAELETRLPRRIKAEAMRYRLQHLPGRPPAREVQIEIQIIEHALRYRSATAAYHAAAG